LATLSIDLLASSEEQDRRNVFDIHLLTSQPMLTTRWTAADDRTGHLIPPYFRASTDAAAAIDGDGVECAGREI
jgi:hypothetical protein